MEAEKFSDSFSGKYHEALPSQRYAAYLAIIFSVSAVACVIAWARGTSTDNGFLGGLTFGEYIFNWHPVLMTTGMSASALTALLSYRMIPLPKAATKWIHGLMHGVAITCTCLGISAVFISNNNPSHNTGDTYYANLYSLHSFIGLTAALFYGVNFITGLYYYSTPLSIVPVYDRKVFMPFHTFLGITAFFLASWALESGIMELQTDNSCIWYPTSANWNTAATYSNLNLGCRVGNAVGILLMFAIFFGMYALWDFQQYQETKEDVAAKEPLLGGADDRAHSEERL